MVRYLLYLALMTVLSGCFAEPDLSTCGSSTSCPLAHQVCREGLCFHYAVDFDVPLCGPDEAKGCCRLDHGYGEHPECSVPLPAAAKAAGAPTRRGDRVALLAREEEGDRLVRWRMGQPSVTTAMPPEWSGGSGEGPARPLLTADGRACLADAGGIWCEVAPGQSVERILSVEGALGRAAVCGSGARAMASAAGLVWSDGGTPVVVPLEIGTLPETSGPMIHDPSGLVALPVESASEVVVVRPSGGGEVVGTLDATMIPGGLLGLGLDSDTLYVVSAGGMVATLDLSAAPEVVEGWSLSGAVGELGAGPVVESGGEVVVVGRQGTLYRASEKKRHVPESWDEVGALSALQALQWGGIMGIGGPGSPALHFHVPGAVLPWLPALSGRLHLQWESGACTPLAATAAGAEGSAVVTCEEKGATGVVVPVPGATDVPWPEAQGPGASRCYE